MAEESNKIIIESDENIVIQVFEGSVNINSDGSPIPDGGTTNQVLIKNSNDSGDFKWADPQSGPAGTNGQSAYEIWQSQGNSGTEQDFLSSLKGDRGIEGDTGESAYLIWINEGNTGTEQDFLNSLRGTQGPQGIQGEEGSQGPIGLQGPAGTNGSNGEDGLSAYQVAVNEGFLGTEAEWLDTLKGPKGDSPLIWERVTESRTLNETDKGKIFYNDTANDYILTIPPHSILDFVQDVAFAFVAESSGTLSVQWFDGTNYQGARTIAEGVMFNVLRRGPDDWNPYNAGNYLVYTPVIGTELHTQSNAVSIANEADATTGWASNGLTLSSVTGDVFDGTQAFECVAPGSGSSERINYSFPVTSGKEYTIKIAAKILSGATPSFAVWVGFSNFSSQGISSSWQEYEFNLIANITGTATIRLGYASGASTFRIDKVSILEL